jgi:hypothetical protein
MIVTVLLFAVALIAGYMTWQSPGTEKETPTPLPKPNETVSASLAEANATQNTPPVLKTAAPAAPAVKTVANVTPPPAKPAVQNVPAPATPPASAPKNMPIAASAVPAVNPTPSPTPVAAAPQPRNSRLFEVNTEKSSNLDPLSAFDNNPKYETALAVARDYYGKSNYSEAAIWAKKANQMNREGEEAWMLYAKSYYAQGRKNEAIGVLELYMNYKDSKAAAEQLHIWKQTPSK